MFVFKKIVHPYDRLFANHHFDAKYIIIPNDTKDFPNATRVRKPFSPWSKIEFNCKIQITSLLQITLVVGFQVTLLDQNAYPFMQKYSMNKYNK